MENRILGLYGIAQENGRKKEGCEEKGLWSGTRKYKTAVTAETGRTQNLHLTHARAGERGLNWNSPHHLTDAKPTPPSSPPPPSRPPTRTGQRSVSQQRPTTMVVRSAQKNMDDVQKIRAAMEGNKPVITVAQQELIIKYADIIGEDGKAMIKVIEEEARKPDKMPADIFKLIESCLTSLSQKAKRQGLSDEVIKQREPVRLLQVEAIGEHATMLHANRLNGDKLGEESVRKAMKKLVDEYMAAVEQDKDDGLDPDTARVWKEQVHEIVAKAKLDQPVASCGMSKSGPVAHPRVKDRLTPLRSAIEQATYTMQAVARELTNPNETVLRGFGKQLGNSKKEIMTVSKDLVVDQPADVATEVTRLASEACEAIKASRESIRTAQRELGAASDISEASGPVRTQLPLPGRPVVGCIDPEWAAGSRPAAASWFQRPPPEGGNREHGIEMATGVHTGRYSMAPRRTPAKAQDEGGGRRTVSPHVGHDECPGK
jgi:hypothetical protein